MRRTPTGDNDLSIAETLLSIGLALAAIAAALFFVASAMEAYSRHRFEVQPTAVNELTATEITGLATQATARCNDGSFSWSIVPQGACSHHRGVALWLDSSRTH